MSPRIEPLRSRPIAFAHRGARAHARENTLESFALAMQLGATGLESDVWLTADGVPVLDHDGEIRRFGLFRKPIGASRRDDLPHFIPALAELYKTCGRDYELSLDLKDPGGIEAVVRVAQEVEDASGEPVLSRLWICHDDASELAAWRQRWSELRLVNSIRLGRIKEGPERRAAVLSEAGIDAINMHYSDWSGGLTTLFHRFGVLAFGWDAQHDRVLHELLDMGIDGVYSDHVDRMMTVVERFYG